MKLFLLSGGLAIALYGWMARLGPAGEARLTFQALFFSSAALYLGAHLLWSRLSETTRRSRSLLLGVLAVGVLLRVLVFPMPASDDVYRYLWEGRLQNLGGDPYSTSPQDAASWLPEDDRGDPFRERVNHPDLPTIYPPFSELSFRLVAAIHYSEAAWKIWILGWEVGLVAALMALLRKRREPVGRVFRYLWNPIAVVAFAGEGHGDPLMLTSAWIGFCLLETGRDGKPRSSLSKAIAGIVWGISVLGKVISAAYLPIFARRGGGITVGIAALTGLCLTLPYLDSGSGLFEILLHFGKEMRHNGSAYPLLMAGGVGVWWIRSVALLSLAVAWIWTWRKRPSAPDAAYWITGIFLVFSPVVHPWYLTWMVPFLVVRSAPMWTVASLSVGLAYSAYGFRLETGTFELPLAWRFGVWVPVYLTGILHLAWRFRSRLLSR